MEHRQGKLKIPVCCHRILPVIAAIVYFIPLEQALK
jgi:hypothetical protein